MDVGHTWAARVARRLGGEITRLPSQVFRPEVLRLQILFRRAALLRRATARVRPAGRGLWAFQIITAKADNCAARPVHRGWALLAANMLSLDGSRRRHPVPAVACWCLGARTVATIGAGLARGFGHGPNIDLCKVERILTATDCTRATPCEPLLTRKASRTPWPATRGTARHGVISGIDDTEQPSGASGRHCKPRGARMYQRHSAHALS
jgi:hypothetical protein